MTLRLGALRKVENFRVGVSELLAAANVPVICSLRARRCDQTKENTLPRRRNCMRCKCDGVYLANKMRLGSARKVSVNPRKRGNICGENLGITRRCRRR